MSREKAHPDLCKVLAYILERNFDGVHIDELLGFVLRAFRYQRKAGMGHRSLYSFAEAGGRKVAEADDDDDGDDDDDNDDDDDSNNDDGDDDECC